MKTLGNQCNCIQIDQFIITDRTNQQIIKRVGTDQKKNGEQIDAIFKLIALYLIQKRITGNTYNYVNNAELGNWTHKYAITKDDYFKSKGKILKYKDKEISQSIKTLSGNVSKIQICPEYLEAGQFRIVEEKDFNGVEEGFTFYSDQGAGKKLAEKIFYSGT